MGTLLHTTLTSDVISPGRVGISSAEDLDDSEAGGEAGRIKWSDPEAAEGTSIVPQRSSVQVDSNKSNHHKDATNGGGCREYNHLA